MAGRSGSVRVRMESIDYLQRFTWMDQTIGLGKFSSSELELVSAPAFFLARSSGRPCGSFFLSRFVLPFVLISILVPLKLLHLSFADERKCTLIPWGRLHLFALSSCGAWAMILLASVLAHMEI